MIQRLKSYIKRLLPVQKQPSLDGDGERVDIVYKKKIDTSHFDMYQLSHYHRYRFAQQFVNQGDTCGDFACGTGYGSMMLSEKAQKVIGADINESVIQQIQIRYKKSEKVEFLTKNILDLNYSHYFDAIISFETIEHFVENDIVTLFKKFRQTLKPEGKILFSTPYMQEDTEAAVKMGFHFTFHIDEQKLTQWLTGAGLKPIFFKYQNYQTHIISDDLPHKDFIICMAGI